MSTVLQAARRNLRRRKVQDHHARAMAEPPPRRGTAGARSSAAGSATRPRRCSTWRASAPGCRVLDVAAGAGEQSLAAARRVGPSGHVLATDIAPALLELRRAPMRSAAGLADIVATRELDGEALDTLAGRFVRRRHQPRRPDLLPRPAARAGRHEARAEAGRARRGDRLLDARAQRVLLHSGEDHPRARAAAAAAAGPAGAVLAGRRRRARSRRSRRRGCKRHRGAQGAVAGASCRARPNACASSASRSARCTR